MGDLVQLPVNATPVDFAFHVHSQVGMHCMVQNKSYCCTLKYEIKKR